jgi:hypothetical protein
MGKVVLALIATLCCAAPTWAQSRIFIAGEMFADLKRFSTISSVSVLDGDGVGGGGSVGMIVADRWSLSLALDQDASTSRTTSIPIGILFPLRIDAPFTRFQSRTTSRLFAASALLGYHAASGHRVRPGVVGGLTFMHVRRRNNTIGPVPLPANRGAIVALVIRPIELTDNVPAATVGVEAAIGLTTHLEAVPEVHAHAFSLNNGPSGFAIRPGITLRWTF